MDARSGLLIAPPALHLIIDPRVERPRLLRVVDDAVDSGVDAVHVRDASASAGDLFNLTLAIGEVVRGRARVLVNDRLDVALAARADGVHLPARGLPIEAARGIAGRRLVIGVSTHSLEDVRRAAVGGADFVVFGSVFPTPSHPEVRGQGVEMVAAVARAARLPVIAIGGVTARNVEALVGAGASGVAVISAVFAASDPRSAALQLRDALRRAARQPERTFA